MTASSSFDAIETDRLRAHFEWVLAVLRAQDTSALSADTRARREATLGELQAYADRGAFPHNVVSHEMTPAFIDDRGVTCAVAELMVRAGAGALAGRVRDRMNFASIGHMLEVMPRELEAWAARAGLTAVEMAMVQPAYCEAPETCWVITSNAPSGWCGQDDCCEYAPAPDLTPCTVEGANGGDWVCLGGACTRTEEDEDDGCTIAMLDLGAGSIAPLLAAVFLLTLRRRSRRAASAITSEHTDPLRSGRRGTNSSARP